MSVGRHDIDIVKGDHLVIDWTLTDPDTLAAIDLTGVSAVAMLISSSYETGVSPLLSYTLGSGITVPTPTNGVIKVASASAISLDTGDYVYDLSYTLSSVVRTISRGNFRVLGGVTA